MKITPENVDHIIKEIDFVLQKMGEALTAESKLYYFSAVHGMINRVMNFQCDPVLVFAHQVLSTVHSAFTSRLTAAKGDGGKHLSVSEEMLEKLQDTLGKFNIAFQTKDQAKIYASLERFANLGYATTGNGLYLYQKGVLKI
jgi:hypothetical protein